MTDQAMSPLRRRMIEDMTIRFCPSSRAADRKREFAALSARHRSAIINSDSLEEYRIQLPDIQRRITYLLNLFPSELHLFVRPEIQSLQDLAGKKVNFNTLGTAAAYSGPLIFSRLGIDIEKTFIPHQVALEQMRKGETGRPPWFSSHRSRSTLFARTLGAGLQVPAVPYDRKFEDYYLPRTSKRPTIPT